jgi:hypothetical protein
MQYALLIYGTAPTGERVSRPLEPAVTAVLDRPDVLGWARLHADESATTVRSASLLTDGPFVESKEYLAGLVLVEAPDLDAALAVARQLQETRSAGAIEVRPVLDGHLRER